LEKFSSLTGTQLIDNTISHLTNPDASQLLSLMKSNIFIHSKSSTRITHKFLYLSKSSFVSKSGFAQRVNRIANIPHANTKFIRTQAITI